jgi:hypothetical protein
MMKKFLFYNIRIRLKHLKEEYKYELQISLSNQKSRIGELL